MVAAVIGDLARVGDEQVGAVGDLHVEVGVDGQGILGDRRAGDGEGRAARAEGQGLLRRGVA